MLFYTYLILVFAKILEFLSQNKRKDALFFAIIDIFVKQLLHNELTFTS